MKKVWAYLACGLLACSMAVGFTVIQRVLVTNKIASTVNPTE